MKAEGAPVKNAIKDEVGFPAIVGAKIGDPNSRRVGFAGDVMKKPIVIAGVDRAGVGAQELA